MDGAFPLRVMRAAVFTALALALSAGGQILVTGAPVPTATIGLAACVLLPVALLLSGSERGFAAIASVLVPLELALNATFNLSQVTCAGAPSGLSGMSAGAGDGTGLSVLASVGPAHSGRGLPGLLLCGNGPAPGFFSFGPAPAHPGAIPALTALQLLLLLAAHVTVALLGAAWLRQGEAAVHGALRAIAAALTGLLRRVLALFGLLRPVPATGPRPPLPDVPLVALPRDLLLRSARRRGPPVFALAVPAR